MHASHKPFFLFLMLLLLLVPASALAADPDGSMADRFADRFLPEGMPAIRTETGYQSQDIAITITASRREKSDVYVADIYLRSVESFQQAYAGDDWNKSSATVSDMAADAKAVLAMTGDNAQYFKSGIIVGNGNLIRGSHNRMRDLCVLYRDGVMKTYPARELDNAAVLADSANIWQTFLFGPVLLDDNGHALSQFNSNVRPSNPRSAIGYYEPGHYCFVQVDGRGAPSKLEPGKQSTGFTLKQLSALMEELGCTSAYNLDGGQSSMLWYDGQVISSPYHGGRRLGGIVLIKEWSPADDSDSYLVVDD